MAVPPALSGVAGGRVIDPDARPPAASRCATCTGASPASPTTCSRPPSPDGPGEVAVVAHGGTLRVLTAYLRGVPVERMSWEPLANGSVVRLPARSRTPAYP